MNTNGDQNINMTTQSFILPGVPRAARYLSFTVRPGVTPNATAEMVKNLRVNEHTVIGIGSPLVAHWDSNIEGLRWFPALVGPGIEVPSTQYALWLWLRGDNPGDVALRSLAIEDSVRAAFRLQQSVDAFKYGEGDLGLDLTGYEDGTENPTGQDAVDAAITEGGTEGMAGSSFVAVQKWVHDLRHFSSLTQTEQDDIIGRRKSDNTEIEDAPESAHVKRTEQESFEPEAFILRRSMPFAGSNGQGLMFVAFGKSLDPFEVQMKRMMGQEDGIPDALFQFSRAVSGEYYWCPPVRDGRLDLTAVGL